MRTFLVFFATLLFSLTLTAQVHEGNFTIRFEPTVVLQSKTEVPFSIVIRDARSKPVEHAQVTLQIKNSDGMGVKDFRATMTSPGAYIATPGFATAGSWSVYVEVRRNDEMSARTIQFQVAP